MTFVDWLTETVEQVQSDGLLTGSKHAAQDFSIGALRRVAFQQNIRFGEQIYNRDWDVLLVLDGCRYDLMTEVADEYEFLPPADEIPEFRSAGSHSYEWHLKNFTTSNLGFVNNTSLITGNPFSLIFDPEDDSWSEFEEFTREYDVTQSDFQHLDTALLSEWDTDLGMIPPRPITDRGIAYHRENNPNQLILHYMQPHIPFRHADFHEGYDFDNLGDPIEDGKSTWFQLRDGEIDRDEFWDAYRDNLRWVLDEVELVLENMDAETVVITADHGNAAGEWRCWGHPPFTPISALHVVPWIEVSATDTGSYHPDVSATPDDNSETVEDEEVMNRLENLGYT